MQFLKKVLTAVFVAGAASVSFVLTLLIVLLLLVGVVAAGLGLEEPSEGPEWSRPLEKTWLCGHGTEEDPEIVYIAIRGAIMPAEESEGLFSAGGSCYAFALRSIRAATEDDDVRGLCLMIDSPGGTVTESDILADAVRRFRASRKDRFVIVHMGALCCSGGYYVAAGADCIVAHPTTVTGSIGVLMNGYNAAELAKKVGVKSVVVASGTNKAMLDPLVEVNPEHIAILKKTVDSDYERFLSVVSKGRKLPVEKIRPLADGRVLSAEDACKAKLVDEIGYAEDVWKKAAKLANAKAVRIYRYEEPFGLHSLFSPASFARFGRAFFRGIAAEAGDSALRSEYRLR